MTARRRRLAYLLLAAALAFVALEYLLFVDPPSDPPRSADVVVALGGNDQPSRIKTAVALANQREHGVLLISVLSKECPWQRQYPQLTVVCFIPEPKTTQGEARWVTTYARQHGGSSITVAVTADQLLRAQLRFSRCWDHQLNMVEAPTQTSSVIDRIPYQSAAMVKALLIQRSC